MKRYCLLTISSYHKKVLSPYKFKQSSKGIISLPIQAAMKSSHFILKISLERYYITNFRYTWNGITLQIQDIHGKVLYYQSTYPWKGITLPIQGRSYHHNSYVLRFNLGYQAFRPTIIQCEKPFKFITQTIHVGTILSIIITLIINN